MEETEKFKKMIELSYKPDVFEQFYYDLKKKDINNHDLKIVVKEITSHWETEKLTEHLQITLNHNKITSIGCKIISKAQWAQLRYLSLSHNPIGDEGCHELCKGRWIELEQLKLKNIGMTTKGCKWLSIACWHLTQLDICHFLVMKNKMKLGKGVFKCQVPWSQAYSVMINIKKNDKSIEQF